MQDANNHNIQALNAGAGTTGACGTCVESTLAVHGGSVLPGKHTPPGGSADAVFVTCAGGVALTVAVTVYTAAPPAGNVPIVSLSAPLPLAAQVAPPLGAQVHVWLAMPAGIGSLTGVSSADTDPVFVTVIV